MLLGTVVVSVAGVARVYASIYTLKMGQRKIEEAATYGASVLAQLRGYAGRIWALGLHGAVGCFPGLVGKLAMDCHRHA